MSGDPEAPQSEPDRVGQRRHHAPAASPATPPSDEERRERSTAARFAGAGLQFAATILLFLWLGNWLDTKLGTGSLFLYLCVFLGAGGAFYAMYRQLMASLERDEQARRARKGAGAGASPPTPPGDAP